MQLQCLSALMHLQCEYDFNFVPIMKLKIIIMKKYVNSRIQKHRFKRMNKHFLKQVKQVFNSDQMMS